MLDENRRLRLRKSGRILIYLLIAGYLFAVLDSLNSIESALSSIESDIGSIRGDVGSIQSDVSSIKVMSVLSRATPGLSNQYRKVIEKTRS